MSGVDWPYELGALVPSIGVGLLFWFVMRALLRADRSEREADRVAEREYLAAHGPSPAEAVSDAPVGAAADGAEDFPKDSPRRD